jgi:hypothetical protein
VSDGVSALSADEAALVSAEVTLSSCAYDRQGIKISIGNAMVKAPYNKRFKRDARVTAFKRGLDIAYTKVNPLK